MLHFGTDGVRGVAIDELTPELARDLARATSRVLQPVAVVIGRDTRESGPALEKAIIDGWAAEGVPVYLLGVVPTPAVAFASERNGWVGIAITASHNPWADNGIKVFASGGVKLDDVEQIEIERMACAHSRASACCSRHCSRRFSYCCGIRNAPIQHHRWFVSRLICCVGLCARCNVISCC